MESKQIMPALFCTLPCSFVRAPKSKIPNRTGFGLKETFEENQLKKFFPRATKKKDKVLLRNIWEGRLLKYNKGYRQWRLTRLK